MRFPAALTAAVLLCLASTPPAARESYDEALIAWARVLDRYVDETGRTDFKALAAGSPDLDHFVDYIARVSPAAQPGGFPTRDQVLAYHINAYNALAMHGVLEEGIEEGFGNFLRRTRFFKFHDVVIGGDKTSLSDYENDVIRPLGDARVHFALNCMVRDCPRLPRVPFYPESLDRQLDAAAREFFTRPRNLRLVPERREVWLSEILDFYTEDFTPDDREEELVPYVNRWIETPIPADYRVRFTKYDWTLNRQ